MKKILKLLDNPAVFIVLKFQVFYFVSYSNHFKELGFSILTRYTYVNNN